MMGTDEQRIYLNDYSSVMGKHAKERRAAALAKAAGHTETDTGKQAHKKH